MHKSPIATYFLSFREQMSRAPGEIKCCAFGFDLLPSQYLFMCLLLRGAYRTATIFVADSISAVRDGKLLSSCLMEELVQYPGVLPISGTREICSVFRSKRSVQFAFKGLKCMDVFSLYSDMY